MKRTVQMANTKPAKVGKHKKRDPNLTRKGLRARRASTLGATVIEQRTLTTVGGIRAARKMTRKKDRQARRAGFGNFKLWLAEQIAKLARLKEYTGKL